VADTFGGRKTKKELEELKEEHHDLEERYEDLQEEHDKLFEEAGEKTNIRISNIEEEIESMNQRVEKLATDTYEIRGEVRDIHESVQGMQTSLREIVQLYKAILSRYGFGDMKANPLAEPKRPRGPMADPGDHIIHALERERDSDGPSRDDQGSPAKLKASPPTQRGPARSSQPSSAPPPPRTPATGNALDELHRLSQAHGARDGTEGEDLASRVVARSDRNDRVDRVARRDMGRMESVDRDTEGEFTRSLPKKDVAQKASKDPRPGHGDGWEAMSPPPETEGKSKRPKPRLEDLLSPE
jgi:archaellum component FlaC